MTIAILLLCCISFTFIIFLLFSNEKKQSLSREYDLQCDSSIIIQVLGNYKNESNNFYTKLVSDNSGSFLLHCSGSYLLDYTFEVQFINDDEKTMMIVSPSDRIANHGGAEYHYISKLDLLMQEYSKF